MDAVHFGRLTVLRMTEKTYGRKRYKAAECQCVCGQTKVVAWSNLMSGATQSCGCYRNQRIRETVATHGLSGTAVYTAWKGMLDRCTNPKHKHYMYYGGRGIKVCDRWTRVENFVEDMGNPPHKATLDRIESDGNYEPTNCRWASRQTQARNTRVSITSRSRVKGVHWVPRCHLWYSQICAGGIRYGGYSRTLLDAVALRYRLEREHWGKYG